jgi:phenylalanyl-tRNA synthetase beta chain
MKFSLQWLHRYVDLSDLLNDTEKVAELAERFTLSVAELEGYDQLGAELDTVIVARIESCEQHPNADRLRVCQVNDGSPELRTIVCGAPNARPGLVTALALPGSKFNGFKIKVSKVRGVESYGMLCAPDELGLGEGHEGIWELPSDLSPGVKLSEVMPVRDTVFEVDNKSITHRPDLWGHYGIAREVAGLLQRELRPLDTEVTLGESPAASVNVTDHVACPRYCALKIEEVTVTASPLWMQVLLHRCETRAINNLVDTTNFVMLELGQPLHAFDAREIHGEEITVRRAVEGERVTTLDRQERLLKSDDLLICDARRPVALAGVMGLENSEVRDDSTTLILEAANFTPEVVRRTAVRLGLRTEASSRFEKSLDPAYPKLGALRFVKLIQEMCPEARVASQLADSWPHPPTAVSVDTSVSYINHRLGTELSGEVVRGI